MTKTQNVIGPKSTLKTVETIGDKINFLNHKIITLVSW